MPDPSPTTAAETTTAAPAATDQTSQTSSTTAKPEANPATEPSSETNEPTLLSSGEEIKPEAKAEDEKKEPAKPEGAPEKYEAFTVPEGYELDTKLVDSANGLFKDLGLSQPQAQKLIDFYSKHAIDSSQAAIQAVKDMNAAWVAKAKEEHGSDSFGPGKKITVAVDRMLSGLGDAKLANEFKAAMDLTGAGNHPAFINVMWKLAQQLGEGSPVRGNGPSPHATAQPGAARKSPAQEIFPNLPTAG